MANSASGPAWTPEDVVTTTPSSASGASAAGAELLAGAGVAGLDPLEVRRAAGELDQPFAGVAGDPEDDLGVVERGLPARVVERDAALADRVAAPARGGEEVR